MSYHENPKVNELVLCIVNDGNGSMCGMDYKARCEAARRDQYGLYQFQQAARTYDQYNRRHFDAVPSTNWTMDQAADVLFAYYREHIKELA